MYKSSTELKVGIFVLIIIILITWAAMKLGSFKIGANDTYTIGAVFENVSGLKKGVTVEVSGIQVGTVKDIILDETQKAKVTFNIKEGIELPSDSVASIKSQGILGDKYVELIPGTKEALAIKDGETLNNTITPPDIGELLSQLGEVATDLKSLTSSITADGGGEDIRQMITNLKSFSEKLEKFSSENEQSLTETVASLHKTMNNLEKITDQVNRGEGTLGKLLTDSSTFDKLDASLTEIQSVVSKINKGEGTLGQLVNDDTTIEKINTALSTINESLEKADDFKVDVDFRTDYLMRHDYVKGTFNIKLQPSPDKYYLLGVTNDYFGKYSRTDYKNSSGNSGYHEKWERGKIKFNAQIAKKYYDLVVRGGLIESGAGLGLDYYMFDDQLKLTFEAFSADFDYSPHLRAMASFNIWKSFYFTVGFDDFISDQHKYSPFIGIGLQFSDDDLKYLLSGASSLL